MKTFKECKSDCPEMIVLPEREFWMGSRVSEQDSDDNERPRQKVIMARPFAVATTAITFDDWDACANYGDCDPQISHSDFGRGQQPVINVSWNDAQRYVTWLSKMTRKPYRLLTEAEYEYAARAGTETAYWWGEDIGQGHANCSGCGSEFGGRSPAPVRSFPANPFGLYEMNGNVWEWVESRRLNSGTLCRQGTEKKLDKRAARTPISSNFRRRHRRL
jgi:formylglycine-generating enzyme required for sulfatase activity